MEEDGMIGWEDEVVVVEGRVDVRNAVVVAEEVGKSDTKWLRMA